MKFKLIEGIGISTGGGGSPLGGAEIRIPDGTIFKGDYNTVSTAMFGKFKVSMPYDGRILEELEE